jgi:CRP-like cAMP-binding protein
VLCRLGERIHHVHFVESGFVSLVKNMSDGRAVEVGGIGCDGLVGVNALHGYEKSIFECVVQMGGSARRVTVRALHHVMEHSPSLRALLMRYGYLVIHQVVQTAACNRLHSLEQRCCRWLLTAHDSADGHRLSLTHEFLAVMLGVQRPGVSLTLNSLEQSGIIQLHRGGLTVVDRGELERHACECYRTIRREADLMFNGQRGD